MIITDAGRKTSISIILLAAAASLCLAETVMNTAGRERNFQYYTIEKEPSFETDEFFELHGDTLFLWKVGIKKYSNIVGSDFVHAFTQLIDTAVITARFYLDLGTDGTTYYAGSPSGYCSTWSPVSGNTARFAHLFASLVSLSEKFSKEHSEACVDSMRALTHSFATAPPFPNFVSSVAKTSDGLIIITIRPHSSRELSKIALDAVFEAEGTTAETIEKKYTQILLNLTESAEKAGVTGWLNIEVDESAKAKSVIYEKATKHLYGGENEMQHRVSPDFLKNKNEMIRILRKQMIHRNAKK